MTRNAPTLAELQDLMQRAILEGDTEAVLSLIPGNGRTTNDVLLGVYRHAYVARLIGVCASDYPSLEKLVGSEDFMRLARAYVAACPSQAPNARWFSHRLPEFMKEAAGAWSAPYLVELAALERALADAFDAPDVPVLSLDGLQRLPPETWGGLILVPHPSARRLDLRSNAHAIWLALRDDLAPPRPSATDEPLRLLVWRQDTTAMVRPLSAEEAMTWDEAARGSPFGRLCELVAFAGEPETAPLRAAGYLQTWLTAGALTAAHIDETTPADVRPA